MKNMKVYKILKSITGFSLVLLLFGSCNKWLEIQPKDYMISEDFWKTKSQLESSVSACYIAAIDDGVIQRIILWSELRSDEVKYGTSVTADETNILNFNITPDNGLCTWYDFYKVINHCNTVLKNGPLVLEADATLSQTELDAYMSEALALRSLLYFYLVRVYKEVPLVLVASSNASQNFYVAKSSEETILNQIISDLRYASQKAMSSYDNEIYDKGRFTKTSINALLADVCLWAKDYQGCIIACDEVMSGKNLVLVKDEGRNYWMNELFTNGNSNESIFEFQYGDYSGKKSTKLFEIYGSASNASPQLMVPTDQYGWDLSSIFDVNDIRRNSFTWVKDIPIGRINKYTLKSSSTSSNWIVYRLAEIYMMKAEALVQLNFDANKDAALSFVNRVYMRAHPTLNEGDSLLIDNYSTKLQMDQLILLERQKEFLFEGKRWFDLLRTSNRELSDASGDPMWVFRDFVLRNINPSIRELAAIKLETVWSHYLPVPQVDIDSNDLLEQNPFYRTELN